MTQFCPLVPKILCRRHSNDCQSRPFDYHPHCTFSTLRHLDPAHTRHQYLPYSLVSVTSELFTFSHPDITIFFHGGVLPIHRSVTPAHYLSSVDHPISITSPFKLFYSCIVHTRFPAPDPRPEVLCNVTIEGMKIQASGTTILANGVVNARIAMPEDMNVTLSRVLPDVLIFDRSLPTAFTPTFRTIT